MSNYSVSDVAGLVDHTLLKPEATAADVAALVADGVELGVFSVCVSPSMLPLEAKGLKVATVVGFPSGKHHSAIKAAEAARALEDGADEVDMVIDVGVALTNDFDAVEADIAAVRAAVTGGKILKVIIESAALSDSQIVGVCRAAQNAGADFVKTSTGFHPAGGASVHAVSLMAQTVGGHLGIKDSREPVPCWAGWTHSATPRRRARRPSSSRTGTRWARRRRARSAGSSAPAFSRRAD